MSQSAPLILASASPRRHELLSYLGVPFQIVVSGFDESSLTSDSPTELARELALAKAIEVATAHPEAVVLAADTIVVLGDEVIGKPASADDARSTLSRLVRRPCFHTSIVISGRPADQRPWTPPSRRGSPPTSILSDFGPWANRRSVAMIGF